MLPHLMVHARSGEGHVGGEGGGVVVGPQGVLALGVILDHKVHDGMTLQRWEGQARRGSSSGDSQGARAAGPVQPTLE